MKREAAGTFETSVPIDLLQGVSPQTTFHIDTHYMLVPAYFTLKRTVMKDKEEWLIGRVSRNATFGLHQAYCWYSHRHFTKSIFTQCSELWSTNRQPLLRMSLKYWTVSGQCVNLRHAYRNASSRILRTHAHTYTNTAEF